MHTEPIDAPCRAGNKEASTHRIEYRQPRNRVHPHRVTGPVEKQQRLNHVRAKDRKRICWDFVNSIGSNPGHPTEQEHLRILDGIPCKRHEHEEGDRDHQRRVTEKASRRLGTIRRPPVKHPRNHKARRDADREQAECGVCVL